MHILRLERRGPDARQPVERILYRVVSKKQTCAGAATLDNLSTGYQREGERGTARNDREVDRVWHNCKKYREGGR